MNGDDDASGAQVGCDNVRFLIEQNSAFTSERLMDDSGPLCGLVSSMNFHPPRPIPHSRPLNAAQFVWTMAHNPLAIWSKWAFTEPVIRTEWLGNPTIIVSDPAAIRH